MKTLVIMVIGCCFALLFLLVFKYKGKVTNIIDKRVRLLIAFLWSNVIASLLIVIKDRTIANNDMGTRIRAMQYALDNCASGGKLDLEKITDHAKGFYLVIPNIGYKIFGITDARTLFTYTHWAFIWLFIILSTILVLKLFDSIIFCFIWPVSIVSVCGYCVWKVRALSYFSLVWSWVLALLMLFVFLKRRPVGANYWLWIIGYGFIIGIGDFIRSGTSFLINLIVITTIVLFSIVVYSHKESISVRSIVLRVVLSILIIYAIEWVFQAGITRLLCMIEGIKYDASEAYVWHSLYIGLGYYDNPYGIRWEDVCAYEKVLSVAPGTDYLSKEYLSILRNEYFSILRENPSFVIKSYILKFYECCVNTKKTILLYSGNWFIIGTYVLTIVCAIVRRNQLIKAIKQNMNYLILVLLFVLAGFMQGVVGVPDVAYYMGSIVIVQIAMIFLDYVLLTRMYIKESEMNNLI